MALIQISLLHDAYNLALSTFHAVDEGLSVRVTDSDGYARKDTKLY